MIQGLKANSQSPGGHCGGRVITNDAFLPLKQVGNRGGSEKNAKMVIFLEFAQLHAIARSRSAGPLHEAFL